MKKLTILLFMSFIAFFAIAQIPSHKVMESYESLVKALEPKKGLKADKPYYLAAWSKDSIISTKDEISLSKIGLLWSKDSILIKEKNALLYNQLSSYRNYNIPVESKYGDKSPEKIREYYEKQRLSVLIATFDSAGIKRNTAKMEGILDVMMYYHLYQNLLSENSRKDYKKIFLKMRESYYIEIDVLLDKKKCQKNQISKLFAYHTNVYLDLSVIIESLDKFYLSERIYINKQELPGDDIIFEKVAEYSLSLLYLYNITGSLNRDMVMRICKQLFIIKGIPINQIKSYEENLLNYVSDKYKIYPPQSNN